MACRAGRRRRSSPATHGKRNALGLTGGGKLENGSAGGIGKNGREGGMRPRADFGVRGERQRFSGSGGRGDLGSKIEIDLGSTEKPKISKSQTG